MPGFDFMNQLASAGAHGAGASSLQHWIAPTVDVEEIERRIKELKTVQFWLEQNLLGVKASVQALEVQKMTLQTLQGMNLSMGEIAKAFTLPTGTTAETREKSAAAPAPDRKRSREKSKEPDPAQQPARPTAAVADPLLWWGALSQQFQQIATQALQDAAARTLPPTPAATEASAQAQKASTAPAAAKKTASRKAAAKTSTRRAKAGSASPRKPAAKK